MDCLVPDAGCSRGCLVLGAASLPPWCFAFSLIFCLAFGWAGCSDSGCCCRCCFADGFAALGCCAASLAGRGRWAGACCFAGGGPGDACTRHVSRAEVATSASGLRSCGRLIGTRIRFDPCGQKGNGHRRRDAMCSSPIQQARTSVGESERHCTAVIDKAPRAGLQVRSLKAQLREDMFSSCFHCRLTCGWPQRAGPTAGWCRPITRRLPEASV